RRRRLVGLPPPRPVAERRRRHGRARPRLRAGDRALGELVQPGTVRLAHHAAVGPGDRPGARRRARRPLPPDLSVRVAVDHGARLRPSPGGPAIRSGARPPLRPLCRGLHARPLLDRRTAHRPGRRRGPRGDSPGPAHQPVDLDRPLPRRPRLFVDDSYEDHRTLRRPSKQSLVSRPPREPISAPQRPTYRSCSSGSGEEALMAKNKAAARDQAKVCGCLAVVFLVLVSCGALLSGNDPKPPAASQPAPSLTHTPSWTPEPVQD